MRNWNLVPSKCDVEISESFYSTYEELKLSKLLPLYKPLNGFYSTYEELKQFFGC